MEHQENTQAGEIVLYQPDSTIQLKVKLDIERDTVWLTQQQMSLLFGRDVSVISRHISKIIAEGEVNPKSNLQKMQFANSDKPVEFYDLDVIISVGYRVHSSQGILFRRWATSVLKEHNAQYPDAPIQFVQLPHQEHDRFLIIDDDVYIIGDSLKNLGHSLTAILKTSFTPEQILSALK